MKDKRRKALLTRQTTKSWNNKSNFHANDEVFNDRKRRNDDDSLSLHSLKMTRNHHDTTQRKSLLKRKNIDEVQEDVDQMLTKINNVDEKFTICYKFRQFFLTSNVVSNENDDATHSLNIEIVRQLKWWINNHFNDFLNEFNELRIDRDKYLIALANFQQFVKMYKNQKQNLFDIDNTLEKIRDKLKKIEKEKKRIKIQFIDKRIEYEDVMLEMKIELSRS